MTGWPAACAVSDFGIDMLELRIAVGMVRAFVGLPIDLPGEAKLYSLRTVLALIGGPSRQRAASLSWLFETHSSGRTGSPRVAGSTMRRRSSISVASVSVNARRPPPCRRTWPDSGGVEILQTTADGAARQTRDLGDRLQSAPSRRSSSPAANTRRPRSSSFEPTASQRLQIARQSIILSLLSRSAAPRNPRNR